MPRCGNFANAVPDKNNIVSNVNVRKSEVNQTEDDYLNSISEGDSDNEEFVGRFEGKNFFLNKKQSLISSNHSDSQNFSARECKGCIDEVKSSHVNVPKNELSQTEDDCLNSISEGDSDSEEFVGQFEGKIFFLNKKQSLVSSDHSDSHIDFSARECKDFVDVVKSF
mmetsp:Transcript_644/g.893  ORF Transcript_644/g.893 Transcript_644/m.893 type:complete len:167 (-) Transcript_644:82-582(-)